MSRLCLLEEWLPVGARVQDRKIGHAPDLFWNVSFEIISPAFPSPIQKLALVELPGCFTLVFQSHCWTILHVFSRAFDFDVDPSRALA